MCDSDRPGIVEIIMKNSFFRINYSNIDISLTYIKVIKLKLTICVT